jgi:hypothetical protein
MNKKWASVLSVLGAIAIFITIFAFVTGVFSLPQLFATSSSHTSSTGTSTGQGSPSNSTPIRPSPTATLMPTATIPPRAGTVLYSANWSSGVDGWSGGTEWKWVNGMLVNDGSDDNTNADIGAPYTIPTANYAVVASIQMTKPFTVGGVSVFGLVARAQGDTGYQAGVYPYGQITELTKDFQFYPFTGTPQDSSYMLAQIPWGSETDHAWHTFRLEVTGNTLSLSIDGNKVLTATDNSYLDAGYAGIWCYDVQIQVRSFQIVAV